VHNWLCRTGVINRHGEPHTYGDHCYGPGGCAEVIEQLAMQIDARQFNPQLPAAFPRFVQKPSGHSARPPKSTVATAIASMTQSAAATIDVRSADTAIGER
jgi:hypothetical protein